MRTIFLRFRSCSIGVILAGSPLGGCLVAAPGLLCGLGLRLLAAMASLTRYRLNFLRRPLPGLIMPVAKRPSMPVYSLPLDVKGMISPLCA